MKKQTIIIRLGLGVALLGILYVYRGPLIQWFSPQSPSAEMAAGGGSGHQHGGPAAAPAGEESPGGASTGHQHGALQTPASHAAADPAGIAFYTCPMHPSVKASEPGKCPICGMDLTPVTHEEAGSGTVIIDAQRRQRIGVKTDVVRRQSLVQDIRAVGRVNYDETRLTDISLKFNGWIGELFADYTGKFITAGMPLFTVYSPELLSAQEEYLLARRNPANGRAEATSLLQSARSRLLLWDLQPAQLDSLVQRGAPSEYIPMLSPVTGIIIDKDVVTGSAVMSGMRLYRIADLNTVWVEADLYESEIPLVKVGQPVDITLPYAPGKQRTGRVAYIYPYLDATTRTGRVRVEVSNGDGLLKPDMYAAVHLRMPLGERLVVPESAVIYAGDGRVVFVDRGEGRLEPRWITAGMRNQDFIEVLDGLSEGEMVVTSGNFLIASESRLKAAVEKW